MSELTAQFELQLLDRMSGPLREVLDRVEALNRVLSQFNGAENTAAGAATQLDDALHEATSGANAVSDALARTNSVLGETSAAGAEAGTGLHSVETALTGVEERATGTIGVIGRLRNSLHGLGGNFNEALHGFHDKFGRAQAQGFGALVSGFELVEPVKQAAEYDNTIRHVGIGLELHGGELDQYVAAEKTRINELARATGQRSGDLAEALGFFSREGFRGQELEQSLSTTAKIATAYNAHPEAVAKSAFALKENLGIDDSHLQGALASVAIAGKQADLPFEKLAPLLPQVAAAAGSLGIRGRSGVDDLAAALAVVRKSTGTEGEAATDAKAFLQTITSTTGAKKWRQVFGEDLYGLEADARKHGQDPMLAVMQRIHALVARVGDTNKALGLLFHNREDKEFSAGILNHWDQYTAIHRLVSEANQGVIDRDYTDGRKSGLIEVQEFEDAVTQLVRRIGDDFAPVLHRVTEAINGVNRGLEWLDQRAPGVSSVLIGVGGGFLALTAVLGAVGAVSTAVSAGFGILAAVLGAISWPVVLVIAGITAVGVALYELWRHWDQVKTALNHAGQAVVDFINRIIDAIPAALRGAWHGVAGAVGHVLHPGGPEAPRPGQIGPDGKWVFAPSPEEKFRLENHLTNQVNVTHPPLPAGLHEAVGRLGAPVAVPELPALPRPVVNVAPAAVSVGHPIAPPAIVNVNPASRLRLPAGLHEAVGRLGAPVAVPAPPVPPRPVVNVAPTAVKMLRPSLPGAERLNRQRVPDVPASRQAVLAPPVPRAETTSRIQLRIHADPGLNVRAEAQQGTPLEVHVHGGANSMLGRP